VSYLRSDGVPVLMYHWVNDDLGDRLRLYGVRPAAFAAQVRRLAAVGYRGVALTDLQRHMAGEIRLPPRSLVLTLDDGYTDNLENVGPVLESAGWKATIFLVTDRVGDVNAWDLHAGDPPRKLLSWGDARAFDGRVFSFEPHSRSHPFLTRVDAARAREEILGSKKKLEDELGRAAEVFSYPHGAFDATSEAIVKEAGFLAAVTDVWGLNRRGGDPFRVRRTMITSRDVLPTFAFKIVTGYGLYNLTGEVRQRLKGRAAGGPEG
jgi:peptidoglycan/xylan/chitin deacetylase (PgdA/CDA1 family)